MAKETYRNIIGFPPLRLHTSVLKAYMGDNPSKKEPIPVVDKSSLMGIEVEVENLDNPPNVMPFWRRDTDGSLRNNGYEYISMPIRGDQVSYALNRLFDALQTNEYIFSPRCSVHVHMNARYMTKAQLRNMMLIYLIFERMLFKFIGNERDKNIHCVPLLDCELSTRLFDIIELQDSPNNWMKYTAVNLVPLNKMGTIEFRHLHGTDDVQKIMDWINMIQSMKLYAYKQPVSILRDEIFMLNSNSMYRQFVVNVFGSLAEKLIDDLNYSSCFDLMEEGVIAAKVLSEGQSLRRNFLVSPESKLGKLVGMKKEKKIKEIMWANLPEPPHINMAELLNTIPVYTAPTTF